jgi:type I restriction enzyme S subunit
MSGSSSHALIPKGYKQTVVGVIPEAWDVAAVKEKGVVVTGKALAVHAPGAQRPYLRTKNVFDGRIDIDDVLTMPMTDEQFAQFRLQNGDVLLNEGQSIELVGRCAIYQDEYPAPCAIQNALLRFRARAGVSNLFASYLFRHCQQTGVFARIALQTTSVAHLGGSRFERLRLPWPTEPEQVAIASALSDVDALLGALDRLIAKKRDLKQAAMQQLLTGQTRLPGFHGRWEVKTVAELERQKLVKLSRGQVISKKDIEVKPGDYPIYSSSIHNDGLFGCYGEFMFDEELITWSVDGGGNFFHRMKHKFSVTNVCGFMRVDTSLIDYRFFAAELQLLHSRKSFDYQTKAHPSVIRKEYEVQFPKLPEQTAIAEVLSDMDAEIAALEQRREKTCALKQGMMQELLTGRTRLI